MWELPYFINPFVFSKTCRVFEKNKTKKKKTTEKILLKIKELTCYKTIYFKPQINNVFLCHPKFILAMPYSTCECSYCYLSIYLSIYTYIHIYFICAEVLIFIYLWQAVPNVIYFLWKWLLKWLLYLFCPCVFIYFSFFWFNDTVLTIYYPVTLFLFLFLHHKVFINSICIYKKFYRIIIHSVTYHPFRSNISPLMWMTKRENIFWIKR